MKINGKSYIQASKHQKIECKSSAAEAEACKLMSAQMTDLLSGQTTDLLSGQTQIWCLPPVVMIIHLKWTYEAPAGEEVA